MTALPAGARAIRCACQARPGQPCTPCGDHLARYLRAEAVGAINRGQLTAVVTSLVVIAPHVIISPAVGQPAGPHLATHPSVSHSAEPKGAR